MGADRRDFLKGVLGGAATTTLAPLLEGATAPQDAPWKNLRGHFLLEPGLTYLNTGGLGPSPRIVLATLRAKMLELEAISESGHAQVAAVRERACRFLGCDEEELAFTRNATEGMNLIARGLDLAAGDEVLLSTHEHPGGAMPWLALARDVGLRVRTYEPGGGGADTLARIEAALGPRTRVLEISHITCTYGLLTPVAEIAALCRRRGILSVIDGAQAVGMIPVDLHALGCDFYTSSGHKWLLGPKGSGLLYVRRALLERWKTPFAGAYSDRRYDLDKGSLELRRVASAVEYGTRSTPHIAALGAAIDFLSAIGMERVAARGRALAARVRRTLEELGRFEVLTPAQTASSGAITTFCLEGAAMDPGKWVGALKKRHNIRVRPVHEHGLAAVRVSTHLFNSRAEIERLGAALGELAREG